MGTRADFYIKQVDNDKLLWLGSIVWDGYPDGIDDEVLKAKTADDYLAQVRGFLEREQGIFPNDGWPWPWKDSRTTDYSYCFFEESGKLLSSCFAHGCFAHGWFDPNLAGDEERLKAENSPQMDCFPNMKAIQNVNFGPHSGLIIASSK